LVNNINKHHFILKPNIYGLLSAKLPVGEYHLTINDPNFAFPSKANHQLLDYPQFYSGQTFKITSDQTTFLNIALDPYQQKSLYYRLHHLFQPSYGVVLDSKSNPQSGLKLSLIETKFNSLVSTRVTDANGQYRFIVPHGRYQLVLDSKVLLTIDTRHLIDGYTVINQNLTI
jgi:hypothetical protein